jgi:hypothetical protein
MAHITLDSRNINRSLVWLLKRLADAIGWVNQQQGKITLEVSEPVIKTMPRLGLTPGACGPKPFPPPPTTQARPDVEILLAVLKAMEKKAPRPSKAKGKARRGK